jgi:AbrB family looped-hinge helix DNA binding protein
MTMLSSGNLVKLGKKGQVSIPRAVLDQLGLEGEAMLLLETTPDGGILLRPAGVYPIEMYSDERIREFLEANAITAEEEAAVREKLAALQRERH